MKNAALTLAMVIACTCMYAQDQQIQALQKESNRTVKKEDPPGDGWTKGAVLNLNLSQGASKNWAAGAERFSFSVNALVNSFANLKKGRSIWDNMLVMQYGIVNTTSQGTRKNDDRFDLLTRYGYQLGNPKWYLSFMGNFRSQFADGFDYSATPAKQNSSFLAPAYVLLSPGILYKPVAWFDLSLSPITARWVIVNNANAILRPLYNVDPNKSSVSEMGAFLTANLKKEVMKNVNVVSRLDLFSNYKNNPQNIDIFWTNVISMKVNKWIGVTYNFDLIYDHDVLDAANPGRVLGTQIKSLLGVGITARL